MRHKCAKNRKKKLKIAKCTIIGGNVMANNRQDECITTLIDNLIQLEKEIRINTDNNGKLSKNFKSEYTYTNRGDHSLQHFIQTEFGYSRTQSWNIQNYLLGKREYCGKKLNKPVIFYDESEHFYRINPTKSPKFMRENSLDFTFLYPLEQLYIEFNNENAFTAANQLRREFLPNDVKFYALSPSLVLAIDLDSCDGYKRLQPNRTSLTERIRKKLEKLDYSENSYLDSQLEIPGLSAEEKRKIEDENPYAFWEPEEPEMDNWVEPETPIKINRIKKK